MLIIVEHVILAAFILYFFFGMGFLIYTLVRDDIRHEKERKARENKD